MLTKKSLKERRFTCNFLLEAINVLCKDGSDRPHTSPNTSCAILFRSMYRFIKNDL